MKVPFKTPGMLAAVLLFGSGYAFAEAPKGVELQIKLASIFVEDQAKALTFYTEQLGFKKKTDIPMGEFRWLTVTAPSNPDGTELVLEPNKNPAAKTFQKAIKKQGIPATAFQVGDLEKTYTRLKEKGITFTMAPTKMGDVKLAILDDTCGNLIQLYQSLGGSK